MSAKVSQQENIQLVTTDSAEVAEVRRQAKFRSQKRQHRTTGRVVETKIASRLLAMTQHPSDFDSTKHWRRPGHSGASRLSLVHFFSTLKRLLVAAAALVIVGLPSPAVGQFNPTDNWQDPAEAPLQRFKKGAIQKATIAAGTVQSFESGGISSSFYEVSLETGIPLGSFDNILGVTPQFRTDFISAAPDVDAPAELFQVGVSFFYRRKFNERWSAMGIVGPSIRSDFTTSENAFRVFGLGLLTWQAVPDRLALSFGAVYLGRADLPVLPAVGLQWTPNVRTKLDLRFPESRLAWRLAKDGANSETWAYVSAGLGGNTWAVTRNDGTNDELSLREIRLLVGAEHLLHGGGRLFFETGLAVNRRLEYEAAEFEQTFGNAMVIQGGWSY